MGLGFIGSSASWSYSGFSDFRTKLAEEAGIRLKDMEGFCDEGEGIPWSSINEPLEPFLNHSDCEGELTPEEMAKVFPRMRELVSRWPDSYHRSRGLQLASDMELLTAKSETLIFC